MKPVNNTVRTIKWDEESFNNAGKYIWIYNCGRLESTNYHKSRVYAIRDFSFNTNVLPQVSYLNKL